MRLTAVRSRCPALRAAAGSGTQHARQQEEQEGGGNVGINVDGIGDVADDALSFRSRPAFKRGEFALGARQQAGEGALGCHFRLVI